MEAAGVLVRAGRARELCGHAARAGAVTSAEPEGAAAVTDEGAAGILAAGVVRARHGAVVDDAGAVVRGGLVAGRHDRGTLAAWPALGGSGARGQDSIGGGLARRGSSWLRRPARACGP